MVWTWGRGGELSRRRVGHTILAASGQIEYAWKRGREREGEEKTGKQTEGNELQRSMRQRERKQLRGEEKEAEQKEQALVRWCVSGKKESKAEIWEIPYSRHLLLFLQHFKEKQRVRPKRGNKEIVDGNASLGTSPFLLLTYVFSIDNQPRGWMSKEGTPYILNLVHAEAQTHTSASSTHTGGTMQLQASTDTEEKKVST